MRTFWSKLAVQLGKRAGLVSVIGLLVTGLLGFGITKLQFATGQDSYLNKSDQVAKDNVAYQKLFGGQIMIVLFTMDEGAAGGDKVPVTGLATPENQFVIQQAKAEIEKNPHVEAVLTPLDTLEYSANLLSRTPDDPTDAKAFNPLQSIANTALTDAQNAEEPGSAGAKAREEDFGKTAERLLPFLDSTADQRTLDNPDWVDILLLDNEGNIRKPLRSSFFDKDHAQMIVRLTGNADIEDEGAGAIAVKDAWTPHTVKQGDKLPDGTTCETDSGCKLGEITGGETLVTGAPLLLKDINDYLRGGILSLGAIAVAIMMVILLVFFQVRWRLLPLAVVLIGVIWAFGTAGWVGIPLSIVTIAGLPVMLGVGIDYAIQMHARIEEEVIIDRAEHPIQETARQLGPALLVVTFDAIFAFAALRFAKVPMIREFALLLCIGVALICFCSIIWPLAILGIREYKSPTKGRDFREGYLGRLTVWLGDLPTWSAIPIMLLSLLIFVGGIAVEGKLTLQTDPIQWVNQQSQNRLDVAKLEEETGASSELGIFVTGDSQEDLFSDETMDWLDGFTDDALERYQDKLLVASSVATPLSDLVYLDGASNSTPTGALVKASYEAAPDSVKAFTVASGDGPAFNILFITKPGDLNERAEMVNDMRDRFAEAGKGGAKPPAGISATPSGLAVVGVGLLENLESNRVQLTYLSIFFVFAFLTIRLRSVVRSLLSLVPVLIAVGLASLVAFVFSLKLSPMTAVGGPLVIAVCTEFTSLIILRFLEERERGFSPRAAAEITAARTGRAFIVSGMTAVVGVAVIATSSLPLLRDFGIIVAMNVVVALLSALVLLPPIIIWAEERGWVSRGMIDPDKLGNKSRDEATATPNLTDAFPDEDAPEIAPA
ncbi:MAG TPA: MMPL family transporter [Acidimicrobiales bacterium]|nr:MMPL family transporter [Acidimicrobiales bacterium]